VKGFLGQTKKVNLWKFNSEFSYRAVVNRYRIYVNNDRLKFISLELGFQILNRMQR